MSFTWTDADGLVLSTCAYIDGLRPGLYHVRAEREGKVAVATVEVLAAHVPVVVGYETEHASHDGAWDGKVTALVENVETHVFQWSNGSLTLVPQLEDVGPGTYSVSILDARHAVVPHVHACGPANVSVEDRI